VIDSTGNLVNREEYTPYGETSFGSFARKRYRFTGKERDEESGLNYHGARYYVPWLARWTSSDPAGTVDGPNLYSYVANNPIRLIDLFGLQGSAGDVPPSPDISNTPSATDTGGGPPHRDPSSYNGSETEHTFHGRDADTISLDVHDLPEAPAQPHSSDTSEHEPAGTYSNSPPGGVGEPEWTNRAWEEGTGPLIEGLGAGVQHAVIDQAEALLDQEPDIGQHELLENQKTAVPEVANESGVLGWAIGFAFANALIIFGMARIGGGGGGSGGGKGLKLNLGGEGEAAGFTDVNPLVGNKLSEAEIIARNPSGGFVRAGVEALPFEAESVSEVIANKLPPQVVGRNPAKIASEMKRVLGPGGTARFTTGSQISPEVKAIFEAEGFVCENFGCRFRK
jgi:RHS repeat-associated protein